MTTTPPPQPTRRRRWQWIAGGATATLLIVGAGTSACTEGTPSEAVSLPSALTAAAPTTTTRDAAEIAASKSAAASRSSAAAASSSSAAAASRSSVAASKSRAAALSSSQQAAYEAYHRISYTVSTTGSSINSITYSKPGFNISQVTDVSGTSWSKTIQWDDGPTLGVNMNAQNGGGGTITCSIARGDEIVVENSSSGQYAVVTCAVPTDF